MIHIRFTHGCFLHFTFYPLDFTFLAMLHITSSLLCPVCLIRHFTSIMKRAREKLLEVNVVNLRDHTTYARAQVDDYHSAAGPAW